MGRSNGCEANRKRAEAAKRNEKHAKEGKSQTAQNAAAMSLVCQKCCQQFMITQKKAAEDHAANKHAGVDRLECFPNLDEVPDKGSKKTAKKWESLDAADPKYCWGPDLGYSLVDNMTI